ncbi:MAG TPA: alpha/beta fold hydrolase [Solirubrobacteraceae bacterium]|nr:alpha/beta fold hydrolase [Solirubrobacteraceae bacterium]
MSPPALATQLTTVLGLRTRYLVRGSGTAVLVLHGWGASIEAVYPIVAGLAPVARVYALDLPGHGQSELPPEPWGVAEYQAFVAAFMDGLAIERAAIVGHSNGGRIAIRMAATEPGRAARLVLVDSAGIRPKRRLRYYRRVGMAKVGKYAARYLGTPGEWLRTRIVSRVASADYAAAGPMRPTLVRLVNSDLREYLPLISVPVLLVWGADDADTPVADARLMEKLIPDAGLVVLEGAGHYSYIDQEARFSRIVSHFLAPPRTGEEDSQSGAGEGGGQPGIGEGEAPSGASERGVQNTPPLHGQVGGVLEEIKPGEAGQT